MKSPQKNHPELNQGLRLIVIDDDRDYCDNLRLMFVPLRHKLDIANTIEEAKLKIKEAEDRNEHYSIAIIDMNFKRGKINFFQGTQLIDHIKEHHPYIACVLASSEKVWPDDVLDLRDEHQLDYYLRKDHLSDEKIKKAVQRSYERMADMWAQFIPARPAAQPETRRRAEPESPEAVAPPPALAESAGSAPVAASPQVMQVQLDFHGQGTGVRITWRAPLIGREVITFTPPYSELELPVVVRALDIVQFPNYPNPSNQAEQRRFSFSDEERATLAALGLWQHDRVAVQAHQTVGQAIYSALGAAGQGVLKSIRNASIAQSLTTNYVLRFPPEGISWAALPWELLWDKEKNQAVLIRGKTIDSCERYVDIDMAVPPPLAAGQRLHLLALSPSYHIPDVIRQNERTARLEAWDTLKAEGKITYDEMSPLTMRKLNDYLRKAPARPDVIHYFGHGTYRDGKGYLLFDDGNGGKDLVSAERLAAVLGDVRLVVIFACQSAMMDDEGGLLTGVAPALSIVSGAVVAMQLSVRIDAATRFAEVFYDELLSKGRSLQEAVAQGRQVLFTETPDGASWYVPTLYIRSREPQPVYLAR